MPEHVLGTREELNLLTYGPSEILVAKDGAEIAGAVRLALREDARRTHGLIADLSVHEDYARQGIEESLIAAAEEGLKARGVTKIDAIVRDGEGATVPFLRARLLGIPQDGAADVEFAVPRRARNYPRIHD